MTRPTMGLVEPSISSGVSAASLERTLDGELQLFAPGHRLAGCAGSCAPTPAGLALRPAWQTDLGAACLAAESRLVGEAPLRFFGAGLLADAVTISRKSLGVKARRQRLAQPPLRGVRQGWSCSSVNLELVFGRARRPVARRGRRGRAGAGCANTGATLRLKTGRAIWATGGRGAVAAATAALSCES